MKWTLHVISVHCTQDSHLYCCLTIVVNISWVFMCPKYECFQCLQIVRSGRRIYEREWTDIIKLNRTTYFTYTIDKGLLAENILVVLTNVLLLSCTATNELAFSRCSVLWSREPLNLQLISSIPLFDSCWIRNSLFAPCARKVGFCRAVLSLTLPILIKVPTHLMIVVSAAGVFYNQVLNVLLIVVMD